MTTASVMSPDERDNGERVIRRWHHDELLWAAKLPPREQALLVLAAGLLDLAPGHPLDRNPIEVP